MLENRCYLTSNISDTPDQPVSNTFIVANRLPVEYHPLAGWRPSPGGLVSALQPALQGLPVVWVGWRGSPVSEDSHGPRPTRAPSAANITVVEIPMTQREVSHFYDGVCNGALWPLYHEALVPPIFNDNEFEVYRGINQRFADCIANNAPVGAMIWVHDYHLQLVPSLLRKLRPDLRIGFFLHIPFPREKEFETLPWKASILEGLLGADLIGFQTQKSAELFIQQACLYMPITRDGNNMLLGKIEGGRSVAVDVFPIGPDSVRFAEWAANFEVRESASRIRADFDSPELILLGVDRLDYTKGIETRIRAVADLLKSDEFRGRDILFIQVAMPSRIDLESYQQLRVTVDQALRLANADLVSYGLREIHCVFEALPVEQVVALYVAADVMLVTSLADGMNLVSKEYVASCEKENGRLVLSNGTGAAKQLTEAWLIDPRSLVDIKRGIREAILAPTEEAQKRMRKLRQVVFDSDAEHWAESFLARMRNCL
jgi:alpha,alpha-trehalose-phosphate synthase [UDP-forming]